MLHVKGGEFMFGSPADEVDEGERKADEGPQKKVKIEPFWMSKHEISWKYYASFYQNGVAREKEGTLMSPTGKEDLATIVC